MCDAKALLDGPAELVSALERYKDLGVTADIKMDWPKFIAYKHKSIDPLANVMTGMLTNAGFTIIRGSAKFVDSHTVQVADHGNDDGNNLGIPNSDRWSHRNACTNAPF
ncbi:hypothetical protein [Pseudobutyrivibrio sp.]|uniref:hypothetical protein n=1 Tax=Pseudobutyrivibrio sp. TaxID=2014367 RepID=UPI0025E5B319|nr:hypothetical protein [Pseudobutyrivibrio sp.]MBR5650407.1 hypothetical protein [Pseudobutyrivibrio sp.]